MRKCGVFPFQELFCGVKLASLTNSSELRNMRRKQLAYPTTELNL